MTLSEIFSMTDYEISRLNENEMRQLVRRVGKSVNARYGRTKTATGGTPATRGLENSGGKISTRGKNLNELRHEFFRAKNFNAAKTSTARGYRAVEKSFEKRIGQQLNETEKTEFWRIYSKLVELDPYSLTYAGGSNRVQSEIAAEMKNGGNADEILEKIWGRLTDEYEQTETAGGNDIFTELEL